MMPVFARISRPLSNGGFAQIFQSQQFNARVLDVPPQRISMSQLCNTNKDAPIKFSLHLATNGTEINNI
jgi:hypothetical protein